MGFLRSDASGCGRCSIRTGSAVFRNCRAGQPVWL